MDEEREKRAIQRIDEAFARAEGAVRQIRANASLDAANAASAPTDPQLADKHDQMRARTSEALTQLDALIGRLSK